eukprot:scaffold11351_cov141-Isochrysis_galbana.AAC.9
MSLPRLQKGRLWSGADGYGLGRSAVTRARTRTRAYGHRDVGFVAKEGDAGFHPARFGGIFTFYFFKWCTQTLVALG